MFHDQAVEHVIHGIVGFFWISLYNILHRTHHLYIQFLKVINIHDFTVTGLPILISNQEVGHLLQDGLWRLNLYV